MERGSEIAGDDERERAKRESYGVTELLDQEVAARVLSRALANGGRFAEVFAESRAGLNMAIDEQRIESVQSGAEQATGANDEQEGPRGSH